MQKNSAPWLPAGWDKEADIVIIGYGAAGAVAAITAGEAGARVILLEKAPEPGGSSSVSSGGMRYVVDAEQTARYIHKMSLRTVAEETAQSFAKTWVEMRPWLEQHGAKFAKSNAETPPFSNLGPPDVFDIIALSSPDGFIRGSGKDLFAFLDGIVKKLGQTIMLNTPAVKLIKNPVTGEIAGVVAENDGKTLYIKARQAVIMTCGGFEGSATMIANYVEPAPVPMYPSGTPYCTGDGVKMAIDIGAELWHMNAIEWGSMGFKPVELPAAFWFQPKGRSWINVNRYGKRFRNESASLQHAKEKLEIFNIHSTDGSGNADWPNSPWYIVFDEKMRLAGPVVWQQRTAGYPPHTTYNVSRGLYTWSMDNSTEIARGWIKQADSISELAALIGADCQGLEKTLVNYNKYCTAATDPEFNRRPDTLVPLDTPPYYGMECVVTITNTQGGPKRNARGQALSALSGSPIPRLYAGGEFGSIWVLYPGACNLSECIVSGIIAGRNASSESRRD